MKLSDKILFLALFILSILPLFDLLTPGLPITHDGQDHVIRITNFFNNLTQGNIVPRWSESINYGFGHPVLMFFYPLPYYAASLFHAVGFSLIDSTKIIFAISFVLSGFTMFFFLRLLLNREAAFVGSVLYLFAPYRFVDFYVRGAIGEHVAFVFPPLVLFFLLRLSRSRSYWDFAGGALSVAGLILAHNAMSLMFLPLIFLYALYLLQKSRFNRILFIQYAFLVILGFGVSAFFWFPAVFEAKYTLRAIVTAGEYAKRFVDPISLFTGPWSYGGSGQLSVQIGLLHVFLAVAAVIGVFVARRQKEKAIVFGLLAYSLFAVFLMLSISDVIWSTISLLQSFQFPWRFLSILVFTTSVLGAIFFAGLQKRFQIPVLIVIVVALLLSSYPMWRANGFLVQNDMFFTRVQRTTTNDTGESSPVWSVRFMEERPNGRIEVIEGNATVRELTRSITSHVYEVDAKERVRIRENTLYFPGWRVYSDGVELPVEFQDQKNRGILTFFVEPGVHTLSIIFFETRLRLLADILSIGSVFLLLVLGILWRMKVWQKLV